MRVTILIAILGAIGAVSRWKISEYCTRLGPENFPFGTFTVNIIGSFLLGILMSMSVNETVPETWRVPIAVGFLGSFTTFSTFSVETINLLQQGNGRMALLNLGSQLGIGLMAAAVGLTIGAALGRMLN